ncbi:hypothetical protein GQR58_029238 [Nymphon striatum]|nr:hypothetical protein GQR58_029238 [Nymphon striatum]
MGSATTPSAESSSGTIKVAAAIAITIAKTTSRAQVADGITVVATGAVTVLSSANTEATAMGDGSSTDATETTGPSVGVAVALNVANVINDATIEGTVTAAFVAVGASMTDVAGDVEHTFGATAKSGASGAGATVALSLALNIANVTTTTDIVSGAEITLTTPGPLVLAVASNATSIAAAIPNDPDAPGGTGSFGLGASLAINIVNDKAVAELESGAVSGVTDLILLASGGHTMETTAIAGATANGPCTCSFGRNLGFERASHRRHLCLVQPSPSPAT